jgi:hypothetical protein
MPVSRPGRPVYPTDFCPQLITFREMDGRAGRAVRVAAEVIADGAGVIESVYGRGHRYATCAGVLLTCGVVSWRGDSNPQLLLQDRRGSSTACWPVLSWQLRSGASSSQRAPVGRCGLWWNDCETPQWFGDDPSRERWPWA